MDAITGSLRSGFRPVIDKTGLADRFDVNLEFAPDAGMPMFQSMAGRGGAAESGPAPVSADPDGPTILSVLEKLGLKLEPAKGPVDGIVVDRIERLRQNQPVTEN